MNRQSIKAFVSGFIIATLLFSTIFAAPIEKTIKVVYKDIKILVDGTYIVPKDAAGNVVEPFVYNGTTYLPIRAVGQALGKSVNWDAASNSVYLGKYDSTKPSVYLEQMEYFNYQKYINGNGYVAWNAGNDRDSAGNRYTHGMRFYMYGPAENNKQYIEYLINKNYERFKGTLVLYYEDRNNNAETYFRIRGDDKVLFESPAMTAGVMPVSFDLNVKGVTKISISIDQTKRDENKSTADYGIVNAGFYE